MWARIQYDRCIKAMAGYEYKDKHGHEIREELRILSFFEMRKFFDITTINKIITTDYPSNLRDTIRTEFGRETRSTLEGNVRPIKIPKTERMKRSFIHRACKEYNLIPNDLRKLGTVHHGRFKKCVKLWLLGIPYDTGLEDEFGEGGCGIS